MYDFLIIECEDDSVDEVRKGVIRSFGWLEEEWEGERETEEEGEGKMFASK